MARNMTKSLELIELSKYERIREMMNFVAENNITEMCDLLTYAYRNRFKDWFPLLCNDASYVMNLYINSKRGKLLLKEKNVDRS